MRFGGVFVVVHAFHHSQLLLEVEVRGSRGLDEELVGKPNDIPLVGGRR
jgi:hypothetical protein